jgi:hypothetical protein
MSALGQLADILARADHVRFTPESRHSARRATCLLCAISGRRSPYSINSSVPRAAHKKDPSRRATAAKSKESGRLAGFLFRVLTKNN